MILWEEFFFYTLLFLYYIVMKLEVSDIFEVSKDKKKKIFYTITNSLSLLIKSSLSIIDS